MAAKRVFRPKSETKAMNIVKIASVCIFLFVFILVFAVIYATHFSETAKCLKPIAEDAVLKVSASGGFIEAPEGSVSYNSYVVPLYSKEGTEEMPSIEAVRGSMLSYAKANSHCEGDMDVRIRDSKVTFGRFFRHAVVPVDMGGIYEKAKQLFDSQKGANAISLAELARMAKQGDYVLHINANNDTILYFMTFNKEEVKGEPLVYCFGIRR